MARFNYREYESPPCAVWGYRTLKNFAEENGLAIEYHCSTAVNDGEEEHIYFDGVYYPGTFEVFEHIERKYNIELAKYKKNHYQIIQKRTKEKKEKKEKEKEIIKYLQEKYRNKEIEFLKNKKNTIWNFQFFHEKRHLIQLKGQFKEIQQKIDHAVKHGSIASPSLFLYREYRGDCDKKRIFKHKKGEEKKLLLFWKFPNSPKKNPFINEKEIFNLLNLEKFIVKE